MDNDYYENLLGPNTSIPDTYSSLQRPGSGRTSRYYQHQPAANSDFIYGTYRPHNQSYARQRKSRFNTELSVQNSYHQLLDTSPANSKTYHGSDYRYHPLEGGSSEYDTADYSVKQENGYSTTEETEFQQHQTSNYNSASGSEYTQIRHNQQGNTVMYCYS